MKCFLFVCLFAITFGETNLVLQSKNAKLRKTNQVLMETLKELAVGSKAEEQVAGGCYTESGSCKSGYYKLSGGLKCCPRLSEEKVAGGCYTESGSCKSGYYKLSGGLKCCPRLSEKSVGFWEDYSGPSKDCYSFNKNCHGCRGYLDSCCSDKNCAGSRQCKAGVWSYSCDNKGAEQETSVGFYGTYKCTARNNCIYDCQADDESKSWYACMKECPKSLCDEDAATDSMDPESEDAEEAVGLTCSKDGFEGTVTSDSWCDKRDGVWMHKCSDCKHGYYWYWWHTYCCTRGKGGCTCAYN